MLWGLGLALGAGPLTAERLELISRDRIASDHEFFGGLSAIEIDQKGTRSFMLSDKGNLFRLDIDRDAKFNVADLKTTHFAWTGGDSEGLAITPDNAFYVSTEQLAQVNLAWFLCYPVHPDFVDLYGNAGLEALALASDGALIALPEQTVREVFPIYRFHQGVWSILAELPEDPDGFVPVGADFGPDGRLWILERAFGLWGFRTRIRTWTPEAIQVHLLTDYAEFDNLEGISVWRDPFGQTRITLVSDDNFVQFLRSELVEYILRP